MSWEKIKLKDCCISIADGDHQPAPKSEQGIKFIKIKDIRNNTISFSEALFVPVEYYRKLQSDRKPQRNDVLYSVVGSFGLSAFVNTDDSFCFERNIALLRPKNNIIPKFLYYAVSAPDFYNQANNAAIGAAQKLISLTRLKEMMIPYPPIKKQQRIADILSAYDDLIENHQKQIKLLEEAAQRLYKEWFVDLRFPGYEHTKIVDGVPEGWDNVPLKKVVSYEIGGGWGEDVITGKSDYPGFVIRGTDIDGIKRGELLSIPYRFHAQGNLASRKLQDGDIVFEVSGGSKNTGVAKTLLITKSLLEMWKDPVICASFCKLMRFDKPQIAQYIYDSLQYWRAVGETEEYEKKSASSIINYRWKDFLEQKYVLIPDQEILQKYYAMSSSLYKQAVIYAITISRATLSRDHLLPRLMSREVEV